MEPSERDSAERPRRLRLSPSSKRSGAIHQGREDACCQDDLVIDAASRMTSTWPTGCRMSHGWTTAPDSPRTKPVTEARGSEVREAWSERPEEPSGLVRVTGEHDLAR